MITYIGIIAYYDSIGNTYQLVFSNVDKCQYGVIQPKNEILHGHSHILLYISETWYCWTRTTDTFIQTKYRLSFLIIAVGHQGLPVWCYDYSKSSFLTPFCTNLHYIMITYIGIIAYYDGIGNTYQLVFSNVDKCQYGVIHPKNEILHGYSHIWLHISESLYCQFKFKQSTI